MSEIINIEIRNIDDLILSMESRIAQLDSEVDKYNTAAREAAIKRCECSKILNLCHGLKQSTESNR